jgi:hypothetical protein
MRRLLRPLWILLALVFLVEAWLWSHLAPIVARVVGLFTFPALKARLAAWLERLPPAVTLVVFVVPMLLVLPMKLLGVWMLARGSWLGALAVLALAKVVSVGITAFIFQVVKPKLLQLRWFCWVYQRVLAALAWAHRQIDPVRERMRAWMRATLAPLAARLRALSLRWKARRRALWVRRLARLRRRSQRV